jgi:hypothetical protein
LDLIAPHTTSSATTAITVWAAKPAVRPNGPTIKPETVVLREAPRVAEVMAATEAELSVPDNVPEMKIEIGRQLG